MTSHHQEVHNLKQEIKRLKIDMMEVQSHYAKQIRALKREIIKPQTDINQEPNHWSEVLRAICEVFDMTPDTVISQSRQRNVMNARHLFAHICRKRLGLTLTEIGLICRRDHSTIISSVRQFGDILSTDKEMQRYHARVHEILHQRLP